MARPATGIKISIAAAAEAHLLKRLKQFFRDAALQFLFQMRIKLIGVAVIMLGDVVLR